MCAMRPTVLLAILAALAGCRSRSQGTPAATRSQKVAELRLADWQPRPQLRVERTAITRAAILAIDAHAHLEDVRDAAALVQRMTALNIEMIVNLDGDWDQHLQRALQRFDRTYPGRFVTLAQLDFDGVEDPAWGPRTAAALARDLDAGARGLKIHKTLGLKYCDRKGALLRVDDPRFDPIWRLCGKKGRPVVMHTADPAAFFQPLDAKNERWHELVEHPEWSYAAAKWPRRAALFAQRDRVLARHRETTFVAAHLAGNAEDLAQVGRWLDAHPNLLVGLEATISELGRQPRAARRFLVQYQDRVLFGTDTSGGGEEAYRTYFRFLETADEHFDSTPANGRQGIWRVAGLELPEAVLRKLYRDNARRVFGL